MNYAKGVTLGHEPREPRRFLEQQPEELPFRQSEQEQAGQPEQQPGLPSVFPRSFIFSGQSRGLQGAPGRVLEGSILECGDVRRLAEAKTKWKWRRGRAYKRQFAKTGAGTIFVKHIPARARATALLGVHLSFFELG